MPELQNFKNELSSFVKAPFERCMELHDHSVLQAACQRELKAPVRSSLNYQSGLTPVNHLNKSLVYRNAIQI